MAATRPAKRSGAAKLTADKSAKTAKATQSNKATTKDASLHSAAHEDSDYNNNDVSSTQSDETSERVSAKIWPKYKDDLPNAFNGDVDPDRDFISKMPAEILEEITSHCVLDHEPERALHHKKHPATSLRPHALNSLAAMSQPIYHAVEGFAARFIHLNRTQMHLREKPVDKTCRRSTRLASKPQPEPERRVYRRELLSVLVYRCVFCLQWAGSRTAALSNMNTVCAPCEGKRLDGNSLIKLTDARTDYDLRDYHLLKSKQPGPRAKSVDNIPAILYGVKCYGLAMPPFVEVTSYYFRRSDVEAVATLVHGDVKTHMATKTDQKIDRAEKARKKRVRKIMIDYHQSELADYDGPGPKWQVKAAALQRYIDNDWDEESDAFFRDVCRCPGLCPGCFDVPNRSGSYCNCCYVDDYDKRWDDFFDHRRRAVRGAPAS
ncbi:hypothetical protein LTR95_018622 [Oleoguttula sp. CCFEE 5521]